VVLGDSFPRFTLGSNDHAGGFLGRSKVGKRGLKTDSLTGAEEHLARQRIAFIVAFRYQL